MKKTREQSRNAESEASSTESTAADSPKVGRIIGEKFVRHRSTPYYKSDNVIATVGPYDEFEILGDYGEFRKVILYNGLVGFMVSKVCEVAE